MRPSRPGLFLLLCFVTLLLTTANDLFAQGFADVQHLRKREIVDVRFEGNKVLSDPELQAAIVTYSSAWYEHVLNWFGDNFGAPVQYVDPEVVGVDTVRLFASYRRIGYLDARVHYSLHEDSVSAAAWQSAYERYKLIDPSQRKSKLPNVKDTVVFHIFEGERYSIDRFAVEGLEYISSTLSDQVNKETLLKRGNPFTEKALQAEARRVETILRENGYAFFSSPVDSSKMVIVDRQRKTVNINLIYHTGPRVRNGGVVVTYDTAFRKRGTLRPSVIAHSIKLDSGAWYRYTDLANSERNLGTLGTFETYRVELDTSRYAGRLDSIPEGTILPVSVYLRMQSLSDITPGLFIGSGPVAGVSLGYNHRSFFSGAENLSVQAQYQPFPSSQLRWNFGGQIAFPYVDFFGGIPLLLQLNLSNLRIADLYREMTYEVSAGTTFLVSDATDPAHISISPDVSVEYVDRSGTADTTLKQVTLVSRQFNVPVTAGLTVDWSNDFFDPSKGSVIAFSTQFASPIIPNLFRSLIKSTPPSAAYWKNTLQLKTYFDLSTSATSVIAMRLSGGFILLTSPGNPERDIPVERRLFGGGPNSLRGWAPRGLLVSDDSAHLPQFGGYKSIEANIEWRFAPFRYSVVTTGMQSILTDIRIALFADAGNVWDKNVSSSLRTFAVSAGAGVHYNTRIGTIRLDFGLKLYDPDRNGGTLDKPMSPDATGVWLWSRGKFKFLDICYPQFALGQAF